MGSLFQRILKVLKWTEEDLIMASVIQRGFFIGIVCLPRNSVENSVFGMKTQNGSNTTLPEQNKNPSPIPKDSFRIGKRSFVPRIKAQKSSVNYTLGADVLQKSRSKQWWIPVKTMRQGIQETAPIPQQRVFRDIGVLYQLDTVYKPNNIMPTSAQDFK